MRNPHSANARRPHASTRLIQTLAPTYGSIGNAVRSRLENPRRTLLIRRSPDTSEPRARQLRDAQQSCG